MPNKEVSIIIPVYNEKNFIGKCLSSLISNDYPKEKMEILVFDGGSTDGTLEILKNYQRKYFFIKLFHNPKKHQVFALNEGIRKAKGEIIIRCDAHSEYPRDYIKTLVEFHCKDLADNIGGVWKTLPGKKGIIPEAIAVALNSIFGVGLSYRTLKAFKKPIFVDTVPFGSWKKEVFKKFGLFDENFIRGEDFEYNVRIRKNGGKILLIPWLHIKYYARDSLIKLMKMSFQYGYAKILVLKKHKYLGNKRQLIPALFVVLLPVCIIPYTITYSFISILLSISKRNLKLAPFIFLSFLSMHLSYGIGYLKGIYDAFFRKKYRENWSITR